MCCVVGGRVFQWGMRQRGKWSLQFLYMICICTCTYMCRLNSSTPPTVPNHPKAVAVLTDNSYVIQIICFSIEATIVSQVA